MIELGGRPILEPRHPWKLAQPREALKHLFARTATAVAVAEREKTKVVYLLAAEIAPSLAHLLCRDSGIIAGVRIREAVREDATAIDTLPPVEIVRERIPFVPG